MLSPSATFLSEGHAGLKTGFFVALQQNIGAMRIVHGLASASGSTGIMTLFQLFIQDPPDVITQSLTICAKFCRGPSCENHVALPYAPCEAEMPRMPFLGVSSLDLGHPSRMALFSSSLECESNEFKVNPSPASAVVFIKFK